MARETIVRLVDDLDGGVAEETVSFSLDGTSYEIDLSGDNAAGLRDALGRYVPHARKTRTSKRRAPGTREPRSRDRSAAVREWAKAQGIKINDRGRIPASVVQQYDAAH